VVIWTVALGLAFAGEGMWLPGELAPLGPDLAARGLEVPLYELVELTGHPLGAIVSLGHCSGAFVSADGLVATNHHCVGRALQVNSDAEHDLATDGYLAPTRDQELSAGPAARIYLVERLDDVTEQIKASIKRRTKDEERRAVLDRAMAELVETCERTPHRRCRVVEQYDGLRYVLEVKREIEDVRLVYAPPVSVGSYGGEVDNWMWPRHGGDFALLRAYVALDGSSAPYHPDNVPLLSSNHLVLDTDGVSDGDFVWMAGFPGTTSRHALALELRHQLEVATPLKTALREELLDLMQTHAEAHPEAAPILGAPLDWMANSVKYGHGLLGRLEGSSAVAEKEAREKALVAWIAADEDRTERWGGALEQVRELIAEDQAHYQRDLVVGHLVSFPDLLVVAHQAWRFATEADKPDLDRDAGYQDRDRKHTAERFRQLDRTWEPGSDRVLCEHLLRRHAALPLDEQVLGLNAWLAEQGGLGPALERLYDQPVLGTVEGRLALLEADRAALEASTDPWVELAGVLEAHLVVERVAQEQRAGVLLRVRPLVEEALLAFVPGAIYPDADATLRLTFGTVKGAVPRDGLMYLPQTTVAGMVAKAGPAPFDAPAWLLEAAEASRTSRFVDDSLGDVPVAFLSDLEATGGNSGSATLNEAGELVGLVYDVTWESIASDWVFEAQVARSIHVDVRYLLWVLSVTSGAEAVLGELLGAGLVE